MRSPLKSGSFRDTARKKTSCSSAKRRALRSVRSPECRRLTTRRCWKRSTPKIEIGKAADAASTKVKASQEKMWTIKAQLERQKADVAKMKNNAILYNSIKSEIE